MSIRHSRYLQRSLLALSSIIAIFVGMHFMQNQAPENMTENVTESVHQTQQEHTIQSDVKNGLHQAKIETILISKRESPMKANRRWVEIDKSLANKLWAHLRSEQISASDYFGSSEGLPSFSPPHYDAIVIVNDTEKLNISMNGGITEASIESRGLFSPMLLLQYDQSLVASIDKVLETSAE